VADGLATDDVDVHCAVTSNYCSVVNCQNRRKNCLCKSFAVFELRFQHKQLQISPVAARGLPSYKDNSSMAKSDIGPEPRTGHSLLGRVLLT